jgi:hypothetical protein
MEASLKEGLIGSQRNLRLLTEIGEVRIHLSNIAFGPLINKFKKRIKTKNRAMLLYEVSKTKVYLNSYREQTNTSPSMTFRL